MSYFLKLIQRNQTIRGNILAAQYYKNCSLPQQVRLLSSDRPPPPPPPHGKQQQSPPNPKKDDGIKYEITFKKGVDVAKIIKDVYKIYGPLFIVCHIAVSLTSLGFFSSLVWFSIDPIKYIPEALTVKIGETITEMSSQGGKFVVAYAIHKLILPVRLFGSIWLTRRLSPWLRTVWDKKKLTPRD